MATKQDNNTAAASVDNQPGATAPLATVEVATLKAEPVATTAAPIEYAEVVRARLRGHYDGIREIGEVFENPRNLPTYPQDTTSWFEDAELDPEWEAKEAAARRSRR